MKTYSRAHMHQGHVIYPCEWEPGEHRGKWLVQTFHETTGMAWADEECPHFQTIREAKERIDESWGIMEYMGEVAL